MSNAVLQMIKTSPVPKLADSMASAFTQLPHLPKGFQNFVVMISPWASVLVGVLSLISALMFAPGLFALNSAAMMYGAPSSLTLGMPYYLFSIVFMVMIAVLYLAAFPALKAKQYDGWLAIFTGNLISAVYMIVPFVLFPQAAGNLIWSIVSSLIGFYVWFDVRSAYKTQAS